MADNSTGETTSSYLEKISPKDLVMFSSSTRKQIAKNDFNYLGNDYDVHLPDQEELDKIRVWGLPYVKVTDPVPAGFLAGFTGGAIFNFWRRRPALANIQIHLISSIAIALATKFVYKKVDEMNTERELVVWDYVKKHPQDFPEVFNPPKKYKDMLLTWKPVR